MSILDFLFDDDTAVSGLKTLTDTVKNKGGGSNNVWFRYRNLDYDRSCTVRFLPAHEHDMAGQFWIPKKLVRLKFADPVNVGQDVNISIPVLQMYTGGKPSEDPILGQTSRLYEQAKALEEKGETEHAKQVRANAKAHYIRGEAIAQCFVISPGFLEENTPSENPIRLVELNKQIINVITAKLETDNPDIKLDFWPCHGKKGYNFVIKKSRTGDGKYAKWDDGTGFASKTSPWTEEQRTLVEKFGFWDLTQFLPARPSEDEYKLLTEIVRQSISGDRLWNPDWEAHLSAVKVYRSQSADDAEAPSYSEAIKATLSRMDRGKTVTKTADVMSSLNRTASNQDVESEPVTEEEPLEPVVMPKSGDDVRAMVDKLKRQPFTTATSEA